MTGTPVDFAAIGWPPAASAYRSENSAREDFAPIVFALEMLLAITSKLVAAALRPDKPC